MGGSDPLSPLGYATDLYVINRFTYESQKDLNKETILSACRYQDHTFETYEWQTFKQRLQDL